MVAEMLSVPMPVIGMPGWLYAPGEAVYREPRRRSRDDDDEPQVMLPWCPEVLAYISTRDNRGKISEARYTVKVGDHTDTVYAEELADGSAWRRFSRAVGAVSRTLKEVLASIVQDQARAADQRQAAPYWSEPPTDPTLYLPPDDLLPKGYFTRLIGSPHAADTLRMYAGANPKLALILGMSWGAGYVRPLGRESYWVHIVGGSSEGKTTALRAAASVWGRGEIGEVIRPWNVTAVGVGALLGDLGVLPAFLDELGTAGFGPERLKQLVLSTCQGNERLRGDRGGRRRESAPWKGVLFSSGNEAIVPRVESEAVAARVVEVISPVVADAATADAVQALCDVLYGTWEPVSVETMRAAVARAEEALPLPPGGVMRRLARHLCLGLAGAEVYGGLEVYRAALAAAHEVLDTATQELAERGAKPGERLLEAVRQAVAGRAGSFPSKQGYEDALLNDKPWRDVEGFHEDGIAMVITGRLAGIAAAYGIADPSPGLRELARDGHLKAPESSIKAGQYRSQRTVGGRRVDVYVFDLAAAEPPPASPPPPPPVRPPYQPEPIPEITGDAVTHDLPQTASETSDTSETAGQGGQAEAMSPVPEPVPEPAAQPAGTLGQGEHSSEDESMDAIRAAFLKCARIRMPGAREDFVTAGLNALTTALESQATPGGHLFRRTAGYTARLLWQRIAAWYGSIPDLDAVRDLAIPSLTAGRADDMHLMNYFNWADSGSADGLALGDTRHLIGADVNGQFLAVGGAVELGTGHPVRTDRDVRLGELGAALRGPGYGRLAADVEVMPGCTARAGRWLAMPMLAYLHGRGMPVELTSVITWAAHRRWLNPWYKVMRNARATLLARTDHGARMALAVLKEMYSAFLGGQLRSERWNDTELLRPDWNDQVVALSAANMLRAIGKSTPGPVGAMRDTAWWLLPPGAAPEGIELSTQLGKWKITRGAPITQDLINAIRAADPTRIRKAHAASAEAHMQEGAK